MNRRATRSEHQGFTLVELMVIIVILGVLAAIVVAAVFDTRGESATATCKSSLSALETAAQAYKGQIGVYPSSIAALTVPGTGANGARVGPWIKDMPPVYTPGVTPTMSVHSSYGFAIDGATSSVAVGTIKANGAASDSGTPLVDGKADCASA